MGDNIHLPDIAPVL